MTEKLIKSKTKYFAQTTCHCPKMLAADYQSQYKKFIQYNLIMSSIQHPLMYALYSFIYTL